MAEARFHGNPAYCELSILQQRLGPFDAAANVVLMGGRTHGPAKKYLEVGKAESRNFRKLAQTDILAKVLFDEGEHVFQSAVRHFAFWPVRQR